MHRNCLFLCSDVLQLATLKVVFDPSRAHYSSINSTVALIDGERFKLLILAQKNAVLVISTNRRYFCFVCSSIQFCCHQRRQLIMTRSPQLKTGVPQLKTRLPQLQLKTIIPQQRLKSLDSETSSLCPLSVATRVCIYLNLNTQFCIVAEH